MVADRPKCQWINLGDACAAFVNAESGVQGSHHIRPLHWYVACRLVIEGGFLPHEIKPHTPFRVEDGRGGPRLIYDESVANNSEATVFGGLKTLGYRRCRGQRRHRSLCRRIDEGQPERVSQSDQSAGRSSG